MNEDTNLKAIHNQDIAKDMGIKLFSMNEDTNLKAIHNHTVTICPDECTVFNERRYKFESNSQHGKTIQEAKEDCFQ